MRNLSIVVCRRPPLPLCLSLSQKNVKITVWCLGHSTNWFCFCIAHLPDAIKESYWASQLKEQLEQMKELFINTMIVARQQIIIGPPYDRSLNATAGDESKSLFALSRYHHGLVAHPVSEWWTRLRRLASMWNRSIAFQCRRTSSQHTICLFISSRSSL